MPEFLTRPCDERTAVFGLLVTRGKLALSRGDPEETHRHLFDAFQAWEHWNNARLTAWLDANREEPS